MKLSAANVSISFPSCFNLSSASVCRLHSSLAVAITCSSNTRIRQQQLVKLSPQSVAPHSVGRGV